MPNQVTSQNERTLFKALKALTAGDHMSFEQATEVIDRLMDAGLLIREPAEKEERQTKALDSLAQENKPVS